MSERLLTRAERAICSFNSESRVLGLGRTIIALGQLVLLLLTPSSHFFVPVPNSEPNCSPSSTVDELSLYCISESLDDQAASWIAAALLAVVASGVLPRYLSIVHFWVSLSINQSISLPDGGEAAAQVVTLFLVIRCLNDYRMWHWQRSTRPPDHCTGLQAVAWAGSWGLRLQMAYIYLNAAVAKIAVDDWQDGTAVYYVARGEFFGAGNRLAEVLILITDFRLGALTLAWGTILLELLIVWGIVGGPGRQAVAGVTAVLLHVGIIAGIGLWTFGLIMIGAVVSACAPGLGARWWAWTRWVNSSNARGGSFIAQARRFLPARNS